MQRQKGANADMEKQPTQPFGPKRKGSLSNKMTRQEEKNGDGNKNTL